MFEKYTTAARRVVILAQEDARDMRHWFIKPEHLLVSVTRDEGVAGQALAAFGATTERVRSETLTLRGWGGEPASGHLPFTPASRLVLDRAYKLHVELGHPQVGPEHILLALTLVGEIMPELYRQLDTTDSELCQKTADLLNIAVPEPDAEVPIARTFDVHVSSHGTIHLDAQSAALHSPDRSSRRGQLTLDDGEYFGMTRGHGGELIQAARFLDYRMAHDAAEAAGCSVVIMTPGTEDISALDTNGKPVTIGTATVFTASLLSACLTIID